MHRELFNPTVLSARDNEKIERGSSVHGRKAIGLENQKRALRALRVWLIEPLEGSFVGTGREQFER
ncbi:MAG: hypothetical protein AAFY51_13110, partial [Pseudomonadota bacterium]